ncbi:MAG: hypothetical protein AAB489_00405, partial [Patescibacteria group bacterium]
SVRKELMIDATGKAKADLFVARFVSLTIDPTFPPIAPNEMNKLLASDYGGLCSVHAIRSAMNYGECAPYMKRLQNVLRTEETIRNVGRDLQAIATSFELGIDGYPGRIATLPSRYASLVLLWSAGTNVSGVDLSKMLIRMTSLPRNPAWSPAVTDLQNIVNGLLGNERTAAVWRYQYGVRYVRGSRREFPPPVTATGSGPGTEGQYLTKRWNDVENRLLGLWSILPEHLKAEKIILKKGEILFFPAIDLGDVIGWAFIETCPSGNTQAAGCFGVTIPTQPPQEIFITGDVGLQWKLPLEPVFPALISSPEDACTGTRCPAIEGGRYPEPPPDGTGLCTFPFARSGYLCRNVESTEESICENMVERGQSQEDAIILAGCEAGAEYQTDQGPNVCRDLLWRNSNADPTAQTCKNCSVTLECRGDCLGNTSVTSPKDANGGIRICIPSAPALPPKYMVMRELKHAQQLCRLPAGRKLYEIGDTATCCMREREAHAVSCEAMMADGMFRETTITTEECVSALSNRSCSTTTCSSAVLPQNLYDRIRQAAATNTVTPEACSVAIDRTKWDARSQGLFDGLQSVSNALCQTTYQNTIGNTMCYLGQMMEESLEEHRLISGRSPFVAADEAYPWEACASPDPAYATLLTPPPQTFADLPAYRPRSLLEQFDRALCQINGLPPANLPVLCSTNTERRLIPPLASYIDIARGFVQQIADQSITTERFQGLGKGIGSRVGTLLYASYIERASRSLEEVISLSSDIFEHLTRIDFAPDMCPRNASGDESLTGYPKCFP